MGGQTPDKKDAVNPLSFLVLRSVAQTRLPQPNLTVRYHRNLDPAFFSEAIEVMKLGTGMPAFNNDEVIIPSFIEKGVAPEDADVYKRQHHRQNAPDAQGAPHRQVAPTAQPSHRHAHGHAFQHRRRAQHVQPVVQGVEPVSYTPLDVYQRQRSSP